MKESNDIMVLLMHSLTHILHLDRNFHNLNSISYHNFYLWKSISVEWRTVFFYIYSIAWILSYLNGNMPAPWFTDTEKLFILIHWGLDKMATNFLTAFSNAFSWLKIYKFRLSMHWLFLKGPINNIPALVKIMAWHQPDDKPLYEPMMA